MKLRGQQAELLRLLEYRAGSDLPPMPAAKMKVLDYQMVALFVLARQFDQPTARILEIGTGHGGSGYMLAKGAPRAQITSLTPSSAEAKEAIALWRRNGLTNIKAQVGYSWDLLAVAEGCYQLVFVDGDHNRIARDLPWYDRVCEGGLFLCHDYSPPDSRTPSGIVFEELNRLVEHLGRPFDVEIIDEGKVGMVGFYRREAETL